MLPESGCGISYLTFHFEYFTCIQRLASDLLLSCVFLAVGKVGSSTSLIVQGVEYVLEFDKRSHLTDLLHAQRENELIGKVICLL